MTKKEQEQDESLRNLTSNLGYQTCAPLLHLLSVSSDMSTLLPILSLQVFPLFLSTSHNLTTKMDHLCAYAQESAPVGYSVHI